MREIVTIGITSFRGSIGGEHYYGRLHVDTKQTRIVRADGSHGLVTRMGHGVERHPADGHELKRTLGAKEAGYLNRKDGDAGFGARLKRGDETTRFNDVDSIVAAAIAVFPTLFDETDVLMLERRRHSDEYEILMGPEEVRSALPGVSRREKRETWLMANGYLVKDDPETGTSS